MHGPINVKRKNQVLTNRHYMPEFYSGTQILGFYLELNYYV